MQQVQGHRPSLPAGYRIGLATSAAVLLHVLLLSGPPVVPDPADQASHPMQVQLVRPGAVATSPSARAATAPASERNPRFEVPETETLAPASEPVLSAASAVRHVSPEMSKPTSEPKSAPTSSSQATATPPQPVAASAPSPATSSGEPARSVPFPETAAIGPTLITDAPTEQLSFADSLALHISEQLAGMREPALQQINTLMSLEVELRLLANGALTGARLLNTTGSRRIDEAAYRGVLAASPYPRPPSPQGGSNRFEVTLIFTPNRL